MLSRRHALKLGTTALVAQYMSISSPVGVSTLAQNQPGTWAMYRGNAAGTGFVANAGPDLNKPIIVKWRFEMEKHGQCSPVVANGIIYAGGGGGTLFAIDTESGSELWRFESGDDWIRTPAIDNDLVFVPGADTFYALNVSDGSVRWRIAADSYSMPTYADGVVYVDTSKDGLVAINAVTGETLWSFPTDGWVSVWTSAPSVSNGTVYIANRDNFLYAIDAGSGRERWRFSAGSSAYDVDYDMVGTAAVLGGTVFVRSNGGVLFALDANSGDELWANEDSLWGVGSPAVRNGIVYIDGHAIDATTGTEQTRFRPEERWGSSPVISEDLIYIGGESLSVHGVEHGSTLWSYFDDYLRVNPPAIVDGAIYVSVDNFGENFAYLYALGNAETFITRLSSDVVIRGAPSPGGVERGSAPAGTPLDRMDNRTEVDGQTWVQVTINNIPGWIPLDSIDQADLETEYVYIPDPDNPYEPPPTQAATVPANVQSPEPKLTAAVQDNTVIRVGSYIEISDDYVNVRAEASALALTVGMVHAGDGATVLSGPVAADGYIWWELLFEDGTSGFVVEDYLTIVP